jgi:16S rRNA (uracil1498-N3)-methyltransferase
MTHRRWIADEVEGNRAALVGAHADHLARVLRARIGQEFDIAANGILRRGRISTISSGRVEFELAEEITAPPPLQLTLALSIFKFDRMEWAIEKCTELGVSRIVPVLARRTDRHLAAAAEKRRDRWQRIAREAAEQSRRIIPPEIAALCKPKEAAVLEGHTRILLAESEVELTLKDALQRPSSAQDEDKDMTLAIGPEGGWTGEEEKLFRESGWISASLGPTILRAETAAIAATAIILAETQ